MIPTDIIDKVGDLSRAAGLLGDELGEWWSALGCLYPRVYDCAAKEFLVVWESEIRSQHIWLKEEYVYVEREETITQKIKELLHISEVEE